jgi:hypothetical protein
VEALQLELIRVEVEVEWRCSSDQSGAEVVFK